MKKFISVVLIFAMLLTFSACGNNDVKVPTADELVSVSAEEAEALFEDMTDLAAAGKYDKAVDSYIAGAAGAESLELLNWYFYSLAMKEHEEHGCIGYPVTLMQYNTDEDFELAQNAITELTLKARDYNGIYHFNGTYVYILDGKVAFSVGEKLTDTVFTSYELGYKSGDFFILKRNNDGTHEKAYELDYNNGILSVTASNENKEDMYQGSYVIMPDEYPEIIY